MNIYIILAHPEKKSFNASLAEAQRKALIKSGHKVRFKNLYQDKFNPLLTRDDFPHVPKNQHIQFPHAQGQSYKNNTTAVDVAEEHKNLYWANAVIMQFPLWLYSMPAILKGWCERVLSEGFAHEPSNNRWFDNGGLSDTRLFLSLTTNGKSVAFSSRGRHGSLDIILWPMLNAFWFAGFKIIKPFIAFDVIRATDIERNNMINKVIKIALSIDKASLLRVHSLNDYNEDGRLKSKIKSMTAGQQKPDKLATE